MNALPLLLALAFAAVPGPPGAPLTDLALHGEPGELFLRANTAYEGGDYPLAIALYEALVERGHAGGHVHYNLGNAYLRHGELGRAVAAYRRSQGLLPRDEDVAANLAFARRSARDAIAPPEPSPVVTTLLFWHHGLSHRELCWVVVVCNLLFWSVLGASLFARRSTVLHGLVWALGMVLVVTGLSLAVRTLDPSRVAVIVPQEVDVHAGTRPGAVVRFRLHAGTEVTVAGERDGWLELRLPDGERGWVDAGQVELVTG